MTARCAKAISPDRMIHFVLCRYGTGAAWAERDVADMDRRSTVAMIRSGDLPNVLQVLECNPVEIICADVTEDILREAGRWDIDPARSSPSERLAAMADQARDYRKHWGAA